MTSPGLTGCSKKEDWRDSSQTAFMALKYNDRNRGVLSIRESFSRAHRPIRLQLNVPHKTQRHSKAGLTPERQKENLRKTKCIYSSYLLWNWQRLLLLREFSLKDGDAYRSVQPVLRGSTPLLIWQWKIALPPMYSRGRHTDTIGRWWQTKTTEQKDVDDISALRNVLTSHCVVLKNRKETKKIKMLQFFPLQSVMFSHAVQQTHVTYWKTQLCFSESKQSLQSRPTRSTQVFFFVIHLVVQQSDFALVM